jgi:Flp pilus assembly pilin Flp
MILERLARRLIARIPARREGQGLTEYGLILVGASIAVIVALFALAPRLSALFSAVSSSLPG